MIYKYWLMFSLFFKIGAFSFGGGLAMIPAIYQSVASYGLVDMAEFTNLVAISQATPGAMVINAATYIGMEYSGYIGAILATLGASIPSVGVVLIVFSLSGKVKKNKWIEMFLKGIRPATIGLIGVGALFISKEMEFQWIPIGIFFATIILSVKFKVNPVIITFSMMIVGAILCV